MRKSFIILTLCLCACGGNSDNPVTPVATADTTNPVIKFEKSSLTLAASTKLKFKLNASDNVAISGIPKVECTHDVEYVDGVICTPDVNSQHMATCTATVTDTSGNTASDHVYVTIVPLKQTECGNCEQ